MGGFSRAPKFPTPVNLNFLFRIYAADPASDRSKQALVMCKRTLEMIALGGINDHVSKVGLNNLPIINYCHSLSIMERNSKS